MCSKENINCLKKQDLNIPLFIGSFEIMDDLMTTHLAYTCICILGSVSDIVV